MKFLRELKDQTPREQARTAIRRLIVSRGCRRGDQLPTYEELCKRLGVSLLTIQRAMGDLAREGIVYRLHGKGTYVRKAPAKANTKPSQVCLIFIGSPNWLVEVPYANETLAGILAVCGVHNIDLTLLSLHAARRNVPPTEMLPQVDGVVLLGVVDDAYLAAYARENIPTVVADYYAPAVPLNYVMIDNAPACRRVMDRLLALGHRRIAYVDGGTMDSMGQVWIESRDTVERREAYQLAMQGLEPRVYSLITGSGDVKTAAEDMTRGSNRPTAFVAYDASVALQLIAELQGRGIRVPQDVSVAAMIGVKAEARADGKALTLNLVDFRDMGKMAMELLIKRCAGARPVKAEVERIGSVFVPGETICPVK